MEQIDSGTAGKILSRIIQAGIPVEITKYGRPVAWLVFSEPEPEEEAPPPPENLAALPTPDEVIKLGTNATPADVDRLRHKVEQQQRDDILRGVNRKSKG
jgi:antitoxin (DNA-binding transcriptional repressor) of toxin-antitoxin stability system